MTRRKDETPEEYRARRREYYRQWRGADGARFDLVCPECGGSFSIGPSIRTHWAKVHSGTPPREVDATCIRNHPWTPENTLVKRNGGGRHCRACHRDRERARRPGRKRPPLGPRIPLTAEVIESRRAARRAYMKEYYRRPEVNAHHKAYSAATRSRYVKVRVGAGERLSFSRNAYPPEIIAVAELIRETRRFIKEKK